MERRCRGYSADNERRLEGTTMTPQDTMRLALEALEYHTEQTRPIHKTNAAIEALKAALAQQGEQQPLQAALFDCDIQPRPLAHPLRDYHFAPSEGPLNYTWQDKPHRLLYDLIAAVRYYTAAPAAQPDTWTDDGGWTFPIERQIIQTR